MLQKTEAAVKNRLLETETILDTRHRTTCKQRL